LSVLELIVPKSLPGGSETTCGFFERSRLWHCLIHDQRPLRCKLYPFQPIIAKDKIKIIVEPFFRIHKDKNKVTPSYHRCYGLGRGREVAFEIEESSRVFLEKILYEYPPLIQLYCIENIEAFFDAEEFGKYRNPLFQSWEEAFPVMLAIQALSDKPYDVRLSLLDAFLEGVTGENVRLRGVPLLRELAETLRRDKSYRMNAIRCLLQELDLKPRNES